MSRMPVVAANWKMHKTIEEADAFLAEFLPRAEHVLRVRMTICPAYPALKSVVEHCAQSRVTVAAQNMHEEREGAFTGEVSAPMLVELGVHGVILGHSERRRLFGETDAAVGRKLPAALAAGLEPILCVGETDEERDAEQTEAVLRRQLEAGLAEVPGDRLARVVIAYEPVWAIGTGRNATPEQAANAIAFIRSVIAERGGGAAEAIRIQYGGSVKPENAAQLLGQEGIDGALVGGASLDPADFLAICEAAG